MPWRQRDGHPWTVGAAGRMFPDHAKINIAVFGGLAMGAGAEGDDFFGAIIRQRFHKWFRGRGRKPAMRSGVMLVSWQSQRNQRVSIKQHSHESVFGLVDPCRRFSSAL